ncbi:prephenate dehydrogenase [Salarchaeum japonicum]|uniref:prephenate dehydrogenase n=1 Tax=Salarchaeum japonicum TaxID=555573 RepID=UPI003C771E91
MDVLVVGAGEMGRWFARTVSNAVAFADVNESAARDAADALGDRGSVANIDGETRYGLVCVAVPMDAASDVIDAQAGRAQQAVVDVTGQMADPLAAMARAAPARERVSLHPLFAGDSAPGNVAVSTGAGGPATDGVLRQIEDAGNTLVEVDADEHDDAMRTVQGRTHAAILAFALTAEDVPDGLETPVYEELRALADRVTSGTPRVYGDIQNAFDGAEDIRDAADRLATEEFAEVYEDAGR